MRSWASSRSHAPRRRSQRCDAWRRRTPAWSAAARGKASPLPRWCRATSCCSRRATPWPPTRACSSRRRCRPPRRRSPGESMPVSKDSAALGAEAGLGDRRNMVFSGTAATYGRGTAVVTATGMQTEMGRIAGMLEATPAETTPLQKELARVGRLLGIVVIAIAVVMIGTILLVEEVRGAGGAVRSAHPRRGAGSGGGAGRAAGRGDRGARPGRAANGPAQCHRATACGGRDARLGYGDRLRQDRNADAQRDDGARRASRPAGASTSPARAMRPKGGCEVRTAGRSKVRSGELERALAVADRANNAVLQERDGRWTVQGDPTEGALIVAAHKAGLEDEALDARFRRIARGAVLIGAQADDHGPFRRRAGKPPARLHQGRARRPAGALLA